LHNRLEMMFHGGTVAVIREQRVNNEAHWIIEGRIDEPMVAPPVTGTKVAINMAGVVGISSLGVRALQTLLESLRPRQIVLIHISAPIAFQLNLIPTLRALVKVESARLPFECRGCGAQKSCSVPWRYDSHRRYAPTCACGQLMHLDGLPEHYLPSREDATGSHRIIPD
jgi:hypothetical protein